MKRVVLIDCKNIDCLDETFLTLENLKYWDVIILLDKEQKLYKKPIVKNKLTIKKRTDNPLKSAPPFVLEEKLIKKEYTSAIIVCNETYYDTTIKNLKKSRGTAKNNTSVFYSVMPKTNPLV